MFENKKVCRTCRYLKSEFHFYKRRNGHRQSECRDCVRERAAENYAAKNCKLEGSLDLKNCRRFLQKHFITPKQWEMTLC